MLRTRILMACLLVVVGSFFVSTSLAALSACDKANDNEVLSCAVATEVVDSCRASIEKRNKTLEEFCSIVHDSLPLSANNKENFEFSVTAYKKTFKQVSYKFKTGANVSLVAKNKEALAFVMWFHVGNYDRCRYIDMTNVTNFQLVDSLTMLYDCMYFEPEETEIPFTLTITEIPSRLQRTLTCKVPSYTNLNPVTVVEWKSMICVELYYDEKVARAHVWFQTAPQEFEKSNMSYNICLYKDGSVVENLTLFAAEPFESSAKLEFLKLLPGNYSVEVHPVHPDCNARCLTTTSWPFRVLEGSSAPTISYGYVGLIVGGVVLLIVVILVTRKFIRFKMPRGGASVFPIYVFDRKSHFILMKQFATLLKALDLKVRFDEWEVRGQDPAIWVRQGVAKDKFIIIVWSDKAIKRYNETITDDEVRDEPKYLTSHLFRGNLDYVSNRLHKSCSAVNPHPHNSVCNIYWDSSTEKRIPDEFKLMPTFMMPKHFSRLMRYLQGSPLPHNLPCEPFLYRENFKKCNEYTIFLNLLDRYKSKLSSGQESDEDDVPDFETITNFNPSQVLVNIDNVVPEEQHPNDSLVDLGYVSVSAENIYPSIQVANESRSESIDDNNSVLDQAFVNDILA